MIAASIRSPFEEERKDTSGCISYASTKSFIDQTRSIATQLKRHLYLSVNLFYLLSIIIIKLYNYVKITKF